jgi:hypothetical protein
LSWRRKRLIGVKFEPTRFKGDRPAVQAQLSFRRSKTGGVPTEIPGQVEDAKR